MRFRYEYSTMKGFASRYIYYKSNRQSIITIPRPIIEAFELNWQDKDEIYISFRIIDNQSGLYLYKRDKKLKQQTFSYRDEFDNPIIPYGYLSNYIYYESINRSQITVPRSIIDASSLNWKHGDRIFITLKTIEDLVISNPRFDSLMKDTKQANTPHTWLHYKGLFLFKKED